MNIPAPPDSPSLKILLVDDEEIVLKATCDYLVTCFGFDVDITESGELALTMLARTQYDAIIADYDMDEMSGLDLLSTIRKNGDQTPFIMFTGKGREEVVIASFELGADGYVQKGGEIRSQFAELAQKVKVTVQNKRTTTALQEQDNRRQMLFETMEQGVIYQDRNGIITEANPAAERILGIPYEHMIGATSLEKRWSVIREDYSPIAYEEQPSIRAFREGRKISNVVVGIASPLSHDYRWILLNSTPLYHDGEDTPFQVYSIFTDITERKKAERRAALQAERISALLELNRLSCESKERLLEYVAGASRTITQSLYSCIGVLNEDETEVTIHSWSPPIQMQDHDGKNGMKFSAKEPGIWADVIRKKAPHIDNSYSREICLDDRHQECNLRILRILCVPVMNGERVIAMLAVANKPGSYEEDDSQALMALGNELWAIIHQKEIQEELYLKNYAIESSMNGVALFSLSGILTHVNPAFLSIWRFDSKDQVIGRRATSFFKDPNQGEIVTKAIYSHRMWHGEMEAELADGTDAVLLVSAHLINDETGKPLAVMASFIDITEKKESELKLIQANNLIEAMLDGIRDIVGLQNPDHTIIRFNKAGYEALGLSQSEVEGKKCFELIGREKQCDLCATARAIVQKKPYTVQKYVPELGKYLECTSNPVFNEEGETELIVELLRDITDQKNAEAALRESEERFRQLFNNASDAIFLHELGEDGTHSKFIEVNDAACQSLDYSREELLDKTLFDISTEYDREIAPEVNRRLIQERHLIFEGLHVRKDGFSFPVEVSAHIFSLHGSRVILSMCRDISERKISEKAIFESNHKLQLLSSITRHDILNSLGGLLLFLDSIPKDDISSATRNNLEQILNYALKIQKQIEFTSDYQQLGFQKALWQDLSSCFWKAVNQLDIKAVKISEELSGVEIFADPMLEKVIFNLVDNALKYGGSSLTRIDSFYRTDGESLTWIIEDDGAGIAPDIKDHVMEKGVGSNTGLGLFLSAEILSITDMTIKETGETGRGARFEIAVPKEMFRLSKVVKQGNPR